MADPRDSMMVSAMGMRAQSARMRIISENIANVNSTSREAGGEPYRRQLPVFEAELDRATGMSMVRMTDAVHDNSDFTLRHEPDHPAANADGYVMYSNVNTFIEMADMREAMRSYEANLNMIENHRRMLERTLDLLRR